MILQDTQDAELLKKVREYMTRAGVKILTPEIIDKLLAELRAKYNNENIH